ncbi:hypothetical protein [Sulfuriroseicoccus oceanibius]|uniref:DUF3618 domain-containing protein n=1 Tax=Sulfuriroseicoccus oceanibius TaxID=2707525 RepID=A0A6B3L8W8_9BACT|nr:hypothetical protein [Sulfuriroseicoccus oceanibius]QQL46228.1 hypothetical protein G3M56_006500 [Sulfuriroseicoccus oceanibius]
MAEPNIEEALDDHELKQRLVAELNASRADLRRSQARLRQRLDLKTQAQGIFQKYPVAVTSAALGGGVALAASLTGSKKSEDKPKKKKGLVRTGLGFATGLVVKPMLKKWATKQVDALVSGRTSR